MNSTQTTKPRKAVTFTVTRTFTHELTYKEFCEEFFDGTATDELKQKAWAKMCEFDEEGEFDEDSNGGKDDAYDEVKYTLETAVVRAIAECEMCDSKLTDAQRVQCASGGCEDCNNVVCEACEKVFSENELYTHPFGCVRLCEGCATTESGEPHCPRTHETDPCEWCVAKWEEIDEASK